MYFLLVSHCIYAVTQHGKQVDSSFHFVLIKLHPFPSLRAIPHFIPSTESRTHSYLIYSQKLGLSKFINTYFINNILNRCPFTNNIHKNITAS